MRQRSMWSVLILALCVWGPLRAQVADAEPAGSGDPRTRRRTPTVGVLPFSDASTDARTGGYGRIVSAMLGTHLRNETNFVVVERARLSGIMDEKQYSELGLTGEIRDRLRKMLSVEVLLIGDVSVLGELVQIDARLLSTATGEVVVADHVEAPRAQDLREAVRRLSKAIEQKYLRQWMGDVKIVSYPVEAEVYLDGTFVGKASLPKPLQLSDLLEGEYALRVIAGGYQVYEQSLRVNARTLRDVEVSLRSLPGSLRIASEPAGAMVSLNGKEMGVTPLRIDTVAEGEYRLGLRMANFRPWSRNVNIRSGQLSEVDARLEVIPGSIMVSSTPTGAQVMVSKRLVGSTPLLLDNLTPGSASIEVGALGYEAWTGEVQVKPGDRAVVNATLRRETGLLTLVTPVSDVEAILLDGQGNELTRMALPLHKHVLEAGDYVVLLQKERHHTQRHPLRIKADGETRLEAKLEPKPGVLAFKGDANSDVYVDGSYSGKSGGLEVQVPEGTHQIVLSSWKHRDQKSVPVSSDQRVDVSISRNQGKPARLDPLASQTLYGPSGQAFIPDGWVSGPRYSLAITGDFSRSGEGLAPTHLSWRGTWFEDRLEVGLSSTYGAIDNNGYGFRRFAGVLPFVPSVKWSLDHHARGLLHWGYSAGFALPYGAYFMSSAVLRSPFLQPGLSLGGGLRLPERSYGMGNLTLRLANANAEPLPLSVFAEGAWAGSFGALGETEEGFWSAGANLALGGNLLFQGVYRKDPTAYLVIEDQKATSVQKPNQNQGGEVALRLIFRFDGIKNEGGAQ